MFIDPHVHSKEISKCSVISVEDLIDAKKAAGYDGAVLTNHWQAWYYAPENMREFLKEYVAAYERGKKYAEEKGFLLMFGVEVTITDPSYSDWLLYGITEEQLLSAPDLSRFNQVQLYEYCRENGIFLVQAHPFRTPIVPLDPKYMDAVEINCHPNHGDLPRREKVVAFAKEHSLALTCGVDYHSREMDILAGMIVPDDIKTAGDFARHLRGGVTTVKIGEEITKYEK